LFFLSIRDQKILGKIILYICILILSVLEGTKDDNSFSPELQPEFAECVLSISSYDLLLLIIAWKLNFTVLTVFLLLLYNIFDGGFDFACADFYGQGWFRTS
jgi:hypothetical protein